VVDDVFERILRREVIVKCLGNAPEEDFLSDAFRPRTPRLILGGSSAYELTALRRDSDLCEEKE
jgi:hypothetical protein